MIRLVIVGCLVSGIAAVAAPVPKEEPPPTVLVMDGKEPVVMRADGTGVRRLSTKAWPEPLSFAVLSPDGKRVAYVLETPHPNPLVAVKCGKIVIRDVTDDGKGLDTGLDDYPYQWTKWTADGKGLFGGWFDVGAPLEGGVQTRDPAWRGWTYDLAKKKLADIDLHGDHQPVHQTRDGKHWLTFHIVGQATKMKAGKSPWGEYEVCAADVKSSEVTRLFDSTDGYVVAGVPAMPGKLLVRDAADWTKPPLLVDVKDKSKVDVELPKSVQFELTTDGTRILYVRQSDKPENKAQPWQLVATEITGKKPTVIYQSKDALKLPLAR